MIDTLTGIAIGALLVALLSFSYGFISAWMKDKNK
jgi:hypothetical protein